METLEEKWQWSHWTYVGDVFDAPEHQEALAKLPTLEEKVAYERKILNQQHIEKFGEYINPDWQLLYFCSNFPYYFPCIKFNIINF